MDDRLPGHFSGTILLRLTNEDEEHGPAADEAGDGLERLESVAQGGGEGGDQIVVPSVTSIAFSCVILLVNWLS